MTYRQWLDTSCLYFDRLERFRKADTVLDMLGRKYRGARWLARREMHNLAKLMNLSPPCGRCAKCLQTGLSEDDIETMRRSDYFVSIPR